MRVGLLRESGGLGDVICTGGVVNKLKDTYNNLEVWYIGFESYAQAVTHLGYDKFYYLNENIRSVRRARTDGFSIGYLGVLDILELDQVYDLFCPAYEYEKARRFRDLDVDKSRTEIFQESCGFYSDFKTPEWVFKEGELEMAKKWFDMKGIDPDKSLIFHFRATGVPRTYSRWEEASDTLSEVYDVIIMDSVPINKREESTVCWEEPLWLKAAIMKLSGISVCVDSGFFHLSNAIGIDSVSLWGPTCPHAYSVYENNTSLYAYKNDLEEGCNNPPCVHPPDSCKGKPCPWLSAISPNDIIRRLKFF